MHNTHEPHVAHKCQMHCKIHRGMADCATSNGCSIGYHRMTYFRIRDRPIWLFWGRCLCIGRSWTDSRYFQNF